MITDFPPRLRHTTGTDGDAMICVEGLREALVQCYEHRLLPAEHRGFAWARPGIIVDLDHPEWAPRRHKAVAAAALA